MKTKDYKYQAYIGDPPEQMCFVDDAIEVDYFVKALETRLKYCPNQKVGIIISAESTRRIVKALKEAQKVVRCKDCKHWENDGGEFGICKICHSVGSSNGWFCADGERRKE